jgi:dihydroorotase
LPLALKWAGEDRVDLSKALAAVTSVPARILGVEAGTLAVGAPADLCLFDPARAWRVEPAALRSQGRNTPFVGYELTGRVTHTIVGGKVVYELAG